MAREAQLNAAALVIPKPFAEYALLNVGVFWRLKALIYWTFWNPGCSGTQRLGTFVQ